MMSDESSSQQPAVSASMSDILFCGARLSYLEFVLSCLSISQDVVSKEGSQLSKVCHAACGRSCMATNAWPASAGNHAKVPDW